MNEVGRYNFPTDDLNDVDFAAQLDSIFDSEDNAFKVNVALGYDTSKF